MRERERRSSKIIEVQRFNLLSTIFTRYRETLYECDIMWIKCTVHSIQYLYKKKQLDTESKG